MKPRHESKKTPHGEGYVCYVGTLWHSEVGPGSLGSTYGVVKYWLGDVEIWAIEPNDPGVSPNR